ncbi:MAG: TonB family protein [Geobacteraceae bacterium]|nr:TonB family protein [Geobacteraceae bacterium]
METYVDREFQQLFPSPRSRRTRDLFGRMVAISLVLHVISSVILLSPQRGSMKVPPVSYLDLKNMQFQEEAAPLSAKEEKAEEIAEKEAVVEKSAETLPPPSEPLSEADKLRQDVNASLANAETNPEALQERSFGLGLTSGYFSSLAEGETLRGDIREYYFSMLREINEKWWLNKESQQMGLRGALINIVVARNGVILQKKLVRSSGNRAFDKAMLQTLDAASPLPPLPDSYELDYFSAPLRFTGPLDLFTS